MENHEDGEKRGVVGMLSRDPQHLHPALRELWTALQPAVKAELGLDITLECTYRSNATQAALHAQGRKSLAEVNRLRAAAGLGAIKPSENTYRVTNALPGQSAHNVDPPEGAHAFDFVVVKHGKKTWADVSEYLAVAKIARHLGGECGAFWTGFVDYPHVQMPGWQIGKAYGPNFRILTRPAPVPAAPVPALGRVVFLMNKDGKSWVRMTTVSTVYAGYGITRKPGGAVDITPAAGHAQEPYALSLDAQGQVWLARRTT